MVSQNALGVELILKSALVEDLILGDLEFDFVEPRKKDAVIKQITAKCKRYVIGALYDDLYLNEKTGNISQRKKKGNLPTIT